MSFSSECCTSPPVESNYSPKGTETLFGPGDFAIYETGELKNGRLLICVYDIFGFHPVTKQVCDKLASCGYRVVMPDFFRGKQISQENYPPKDFSVMKEFINTAGSWEKVVKNDFLRLLDHYKAQGAKEIGAFGFCWGAKMCVEASVDFGADIKAIAVIHPSMLVTEDADRVLSPTLCLPASTDFDMVPFFEKVKARFEGSNHHRFDDMAHGFCAARGDLEDDLNRKRVEEALALMKDFFNKNLK